MPYLEKHLKERIDFKLNQLQKLRPLPQSSVLKLKEQFGIEMTYNSNAIEGNRLTLKETFLVINEGLTVKGKSFKDHLEAKNHYDALNYLYEFIEKDSQHTISEVFIRNIQQLIVKEIDLDWAGKYRDGNVIITGSSHVPPDAVAIPNLMNNLISNGLDLPNTKGSFLKAFEKIKLPKKYFLYVGRISREKSLDLLIKSFKKFTLINKEIDLVIVGDGPAKNDLEKFVASHSLKNRVYFLGAISHDSLMKSNIFPNALAFVSASTSETQGLSVLEACGFKLPVIAVKARALTELVKANGILCQPDSVNEFAKALETITKNFSLRKKFAQKSFQIASHHSLDKTISQLENIYISLINK